jgi:uncharacterized protein (TIGR02646 family)
MHKLDRAAVLKPTCLDDYDYLSQTWDDLDRQHKKVIRLSLQKMQGQQVAADDANDEEEFILGLRCAYCECQVFHGGHIEHFRRKNAAHYPELTFEWTNLFLACGSTENCGHYKDRGGSPYSPDELIKPDVHDPDDYLYYHSSGEVRVRHRNIMSQGDRRRGVETIRVFHLDCGRLRGARRQALKKYLDHNTGILDALMNFDEMDRQAFIREEIEATKWEPYWTTIRHFFEKLHV